MSSKNIIIADYKEELLKLVKEGYNSKQMANELNKRYGVEFGSRHIANYLSRINVDFKIKRLQSAKKQQNNNNNDDDKVPKWVIRNLKNYGNCYVGNDEKLINKYIKELKTLNINVEKTITYNDYIVLEVK